MVCKGKNMKAMMKKAWAIKKKTGCTIGQAMKKVW